MSSLKPLLLVQDEDGYWHVMRAVAHRRVSLCGWLNIDVGAVNRGDCPTKTSGEPTCLGCQEEMMKAVAK